MQSGAIAVGMALFLMCVGPVVANDGNVSVCTQSLEIYVHPKGQIWWNYKKHTLQTIPGAIARDNSKPFNCLKIVDATKGEADRQAITDVLRQRVKPKGFDTLEIAWENYAQPAPPPRLPLPDDSAQYAPLTKEEYVSLEEELVPLSRCAHDAQIGSARFTGRVDGKRIAREIVSAGRGPDLLRDAGALPKYLSPEAAVPAADRGKLIEQVSTALWGIPFYVASSELIGSKKPEEKLTLTQQLRARAIYAYYGSMATKDCRPGQNFIQLFNKANAR